MQRLLLIILALGFGFMSHAQENPKIDLSNDSTHFASDSLSPQYLLPANQHILENKLTPFDLGLEVGTSVSVNFKGGYGTNLYIAPRLSFSPNSKWQFNISPVLGRSTFHEMPVWISPTYATTTSGTVNHLGIFAQGAYNINEKLYVGASVMAETIMFEQNTLAPPMTNMNSIGTSAFVGYKFSDHFRVHAEFGVNRNLNGINNYIGLPPNAFSMPNIKNPYNPF